LEKEIADEELKEVIAEEIIEEIEEAMEEAIGEVVEQAIEEEIRAEIEVASADDSESETVINNFSPDEIVEEINMIEDMINENKMMQIVTDIDDKKNIKNIDGFHIGLKKQPETTPVMEIPFSSQMLIINDTIEADSKPAREDLIVMPKAPVKKTPISSIDFGLIQEV
jgi:flagellar biosynthesis regulator FlbT